MGKKKMDELPTLEAYQHEPISETSEITKVKKEELISLGVTIPFATEIDGYATRRIDTALNHKEAIAFKAILTALKSQNAKLKSGRYVKKSADVYRWLAEKIAEQYANHNRHGDRHTDG